MRFFLAVQLTVLLAFPISAHFLLIPMHDDFVVFDLTTQKIIHRLNYAQNNFGVSLTIDPQEGRYLFYRPYFGLSNQVIRYDFVAGTRQTFTHKTEFTAFRPMSQNLGIIDGQMWELTPAGLFISSQVKLAPSLMWREGVSEGQTTVTVPGETTVHTVTPSGTQLKEVYWAASLNGFILQLTETYQEDSWNNRYIWAFYDVQSKKLTRFDDLSGRMSANSGGAVAPEIPQAQLLPRFVLRSDKGR